MEKEREENFTLGDNLFFIFFNTHTEHSVKKNRSKNIFQGVIGNFMVIDGPFMFFHALFMIF